MTPPVDLRPYLEELERFSDGQMSVAEQEAFEERLTQDAALNEAYEIYEQLTADLRWVAGHETLRHRLQGLDMRLDQRRDALVRMHRRQRRQQKRWGFVVVGAVLAALGIWLILRPPANSTERAWEKYYVADPGLPESAALARHRPLLAQAMQQYRTGHYPAALHELRRMPTDNIGQDTLLYYNGVFLLRQGQATAARPFFQRVSKMPESNLASRALYQLGMTYWMTDQVSEARAALREVAADSINPYRKSARQVLESKELRAAE